jgi:uncharacterized protein (DUF433 family)
MPWQDYIESDPLVFFGKPIFKGTRVTVEAVLELARNEIPRGRFDQLDEKLKALGLGLKHFFAAMEYKIEQSNPPGRRA